MMARRLTVLRARLTAAVPRVSPPKKTADPIYLSIEWRTLIARIIAARGRACERCGRIHNKDGTPVRLFGDHRVELRDGGRLLDPDNVQLLCGSCHGKKTAIEQNKRMAQKFSR